MKAFARRMLRFLSPGPAARISLGLTALVVSFVLACDLLFGLLPDPNDQLRQLRAHIAENLAVQTATVLETGSRPALERLFENVAAREKSILSAAVRRGDGGLETQVGNHAAVWVRPAGNISQLDHVRVPLTTGGQEWGAVEVSFEHAARDSFWRWLQQPSVALVLLLGLGCFTGFTLYLRRVLSYLDPSAVIPDRVRSAFDVFSGGVMVIDPAGRMMLANTALRSWMGVDVDEQLLGRPVEAIPWFRKALPPQRTEHPWLRAMEVGNVTEGEPLTFHLADGVPLQVVVNSSPITDGVRKVRGCLVTFENVTAVHELNAQLVTSVAELEFSKQQVEKKTEELERLATRDPLTGCLNRRALFEGLDPLFLEARNGQRTLSCIMADIDHFKSFNDRHGHAVGDRVLNAVARRLASAVREMDLLCRYGGEEFCIILPDTDLEQAYAIAERLRTDIEQRAGLIIREISGLAVTTSFGVSTFQSNVANAERLIDLADQALYAAKAAGRNCVRSA